MKKARLIFSIAFATVFAGTALAQNGAGQFTPDQTKQIQQIVHEYLVKNPQVLVEASQSLQQQQMAQMQKTADVAISKNAKDIFNNPNSPVVGNPNGNVTIVEFMDFQCAHCKEMSPIMEDLSKTDGNLKIIYKELPIFGPTSEYAAKAALASARQGKYAAFHVALMQDQNPLSKEEVMTIAKNVGLDTDKLAKDIADPAIDKQLKDNIRLAQALGLMGTPAIIIGDKSGSKTVFIPGSTSKQNLQQAIDKLRK